MAYSDDRQHSQNIFLEDLTLITREHSRFLDTYLEESPDTVGWNRRVRGLRFRNLILQFVEKDLKEVMQGREFAPLPDDQKENAVNQLHARWTDPNSEIVKRMNSFAEKSPDILKPILES